VLGSVDSDPQEPALTRDPAGTLYVSGVPGGLVRFPAAGGEGERLTGQSGHGLRGGFSWLGDTLAIGGWRGWSLLRSGQRFLGCRSFEQAARYSERPVFAWRALPGGLTVGEYSPRYAGEIRRFLVVSRDQRVLVNLAVKPPEAERISISMPDHARAWEVAPPELTEPLWSVADNDSGVVLVEQSAGSGLVHVRRIDFQGRTRGEWSLSVPLLPISPRWRAAEVERAAAGVSREGAHASAWAVARHREHVTFPPYHPPVSEVVLGSDGVPWLRLATESDSVTWKRLGPRGPQDWVLPADLVVSFADRDGLWGTRPRQAGSELVTTAPLPPDWKPLRFPTPPANEPAVPADQCW
jgi:hypothetical protein